VLSTSNIAYVHDLDTRLTFHYEGQAAVLSFASAPTSTYPGILIGDINGSIRAWAPPDTAARVVMQYDTGILRAAISPDGDLVAAGAADGTVLLTRLSKETHIQINGHTNFIEGVRFMFGGHFLVTYSLDGQARVWLPPSLSLVRAFKDHHSRVEDLDLTDHGRRILTVGDDGRLLSWRPEGEGFSTLFATSLPLVSLEALATDDTAVVADAAGAVWHVQNKKSPTLVRAANGDVVSLLRASPDGQLVVIGTGKGHVAILDSHTWRTLQTFEMGGALRQAAFALDNSRLALVSEARRVQLVHLASAGIENWQDVSLDARDVSFSPDGRTLAIVCSEGGLWLYSFDKNDWIYAQDHHALTSFGRFSMDGRLFVSSDQAGVVTARDVAATLSLHP
jgi:WD40 repeat protein